jgi:hypothetical protein
MSLMHYCIYLTNTIDNRTISYSISSIKSYILKSMCILRFEFKLCIIRNTICTHVCYNLLLKESCKLKYNAIIAYDYSISYTNLHKLQKKYNLKYLLCNRVTYT